MPPRLLAHPLAKAKVVKADVMSFWAAQAFDLDLRPHEGNCDLCFLKGRILRKRIIRDTPEVAGWWSDQEISRDQWFDKRDTVRGLVEEVRRSPELPALDEGDEHDAECGLHCASMEDAA